MQLEVCLDTIEEAIAAHEAVVDRLEVCSALAVGGLTPSLGLVQACVALNGPEVHVMIRPRSGGFCYRTAEFKIMQHNLKLAGDAGAKGVVFGVLTESQLIDLPQNETLLNTAKGLGLECTFHRAFDLLEDTQQGLTQLINLGFDRLLTSGLQPFAIQGLSTIRQLVLRAEGRIQIMAGSGVNPQNASLLLGTGVDALHFSARRVVEDPSGLGMGSESVPNQEKIFAIRQALPI